MADASIKIVLSNGEEAGKSINKLTAQAVALSREIKKSEEGSEEFTKATEDWKKVQSRLVDLKKEAFSLAKAEGEIKDEIKDLNQEIENTTRSQGLLNSELLDMLPFSDQVQKFTGGFKNLNSGIKATTLSTNLFSKALLATGIGAIIIALGTLFTWLTKTQQGMDFVAKAGDALRAVFQVVIDRVLNFAGAMKNLVSGNFSAALEGMKDTFSGIGAEIVNDTKEAWKLTGALQDITREEKQLDLQRARSRATIEQLKLVAEDQTKSTEERSAAASKALNMERELMEKSIELQERKVKAIKAQNEMGTSTDEDINRAIDAEIELANLREESTTKQIELNNKLNELRRTDAAAANEAIKEKQAADQEAHEKAIAAQEELAKKILESEKSLQDKRIALISDEQDRKIAEINLAAEREIAVFEGTEAQKTEFLKLKQQERDAAIAAIIEENNLKAAEKNLARLQEEAEKEEEWINEQFFNKLITEEERNEQLYELQKSAIEKRLALMVAAGSTETVEYQKLYTQLAKLHHDYEQDKTATTEKHQKARADLEKQSLEAAGDFFGGMADLLAADEESRRKNFAVIKALKIAEMKVSYLNELAGIWENANKNPLNAFFPGMAQILAIVKTVAATARFSAGVVQVSSTKFADGGPVFGPSHQAGGIPFSVRGRRGYEMEGDEIILTKGVYRDPVLRAIASDLNALGGGRRFAMGGPVIDRSPVPVNRPEGSAPVGSPGSTMDLRRSEALLQEIADNTRKSANNPVPLSIQRIRDGLNTLSTVENEARF